ncbi:competence protein ComK [Planococcus sp. X10-3]|uniref:competence protein ComK n=1 Tax=Planococcus sp. X10-3 TaxID=3061240 RepID=UPI003BB1A72A
MKQKTKVNSEMKREYAISSETIGILPNFDENGFLNSKICKKDGISMAGISPFNLIDTNLRFRGSSMRGALDGAQAILDKKNMNPLILDRERDIILFPCRSPFREDCVWLSLRHVKSYKRSGTSNTQVELSNDSIIILDVSIETFSKKMQRAYELRYKLQARTVEFEEKAMETGIRYHLMKGVEGVNYEGGGMEEHTLTP